MGQTVMKSTAKSALRLAAAAALLIASAHASADTRNPIDFTVSGGFVPIEYAGSTTTELLITSRKNQEDVFWAKVTQIRTFTGEETISIKRFPFERFREIKRLVRKTSNLDQTLVHDFIGLCDSSDKTVRFKKQSQTVIDICGTDNQGLQEVDDKMRSAIGLLFRLSQEAQDAPDSVYVIQGAAQS